MNHGCTGLQKANTVHPGWTRSQDVGGDFPLSTCLFYTGRPREGELTLLPDQAPVDMEQPVFWCRLGSWARQKARLTAEGLIFSPSLYTNGLGESGEITSLTLSLKN